MSANDEYDENSGGSLRDYAESQKKKAERLEKELQALKTQVTEQSRSSLYEKKGIDAKLRRWIEKDGVEPTEAAFDKWLAENGDDFGYKAPGATEESKDSTSEEASAQAAPAAQSVLTPELQDALARFQDVFGAQSGAEHIPADKLKASVDQVAANLNTGHETYADSFDAAMRQLAEAGVPIESDLKL